MLSLTLLEEFMLSKLLCEHRVNPLAIGCSLPRFSWQISSNVQNLTQKAYRILVKDGNAVVWDSGIVESNLQLVCYAGAQLKPLTKYSFDVTVIDSANQTHFSTSFFETGFFSLEDWNQPFITVFAKNSPSHLRNVFNIEKPVIKARLSVCATTGAFSDITHYMNGYNAYFNGKKISDDRLNPGRLSFRSRRALYRTYDITDLVHQGGNVFGCVYVCYGISYRLDVWYEDNTHQTFGIQGSKVNENGPYTLWRPYCREHGGKEERYNALLEFTDWQTPNYDDSNWAEPTFVNDISCVQEQLVITDTKAILKPVKIYKIDDQRFTIDFGENLHGNVGVKIRDGKKGKTISIKYSENIKDNLEVDPITTINIAQGEQDGHIDSYIMNTDGYGEYCSTFSLHGFRYVEISGIKTLLEDDVWANLIYSDIDKPFTFETSDEMINSLYDISVRAQRNNLVGIPTDCPHRERNGWLGDALCVSHAESFRYDLTLFYESWLNNIKEDAHQNGKIPDISPFGSKSIDDRLSVTWASACIVVPYDSYMAYGDVKILQDNWHTMLNWLNYLSTKTDKEGLLVNCKQWGDHTCTVCSDNDFLDNAYYYRTLVLAEHVAEILGEDATELACKKQSLKKAINKRFFKHGRYCNGTQTETAIAIHFGLVDKPEISKQAEYFDSIIDSNKDLTCGSIGYYSVFDALSAIGLDTKVLEICHQDFFGSFGYWIKHFGATTAIESTHYQSGMHESNDHPFLMGGLTNWFYTKLCGVQIIKAGCRELKINPILVNEVKNASISFESPFGKVAFSYSNSNNKVVYNVSIPVGVTCSLYTPDNKPFKKIGSGEYMFEF